MPHGILRECSRVLQGIFKLKEAYWSQTGIKFELTTFALALAVGLVVLPICIWIAGRVTLGGYANGGPFALYGDYFVGLAKGGLSYWIALLGPYAFLVLGRLMRVVWRRT
jgi:hypothetical protein